AVSVARGAGAARAAVCLPVSRKGEATMKADELRALQAPVKARYREDPASALLTMRARGTLDPEGVLCHVEAAGGRVAAGLHAFAGGDGRAACAGGMLLQALAACAGGARRAVATGLSLPGRGGAHTPQGALALRRTPR